MKHAILPIIVAVSLIGASDVSGMFMEPKDVPVDRLVKSARAFLEKHPKDANAHYTLARIHFLAFAHGASSLSSFGLDEGGLPRLWPDSVDSGRIDKEREARAFELAARDLGAKDFMSLPTNRYDEFEKAKKRRLEQLNRSNWRPASKLANETMIAHAVAAKQGFNQALSIKPRSGLYALGLASLMEQFASLVKHQDLKTLPAELQGFTHARIREAYYRAFSLAFNGDAKKDASRLMSFSQLVSYEAGNAFLRLAKLDAKALTANEAKQVDEIRGGIEILEKGIPTTFTPVVFSMTPTPHLADMLAPELTVDFDLRGYGPRERWPWVQPQLGFLVWDPRGNGEIASARQLFGSYSFEIFRRDGYDALAALDDNGDGELASDELRGIRVWFDADSDGRSGAGEVHDLGDLGIISISTRLLTHDGRHPMNPRGITLSDGRTLPTWDWIAEPRQRSR